MVGRGRAKEVHIRAADCTPMRARRRRVRSSAHPVRGDTVSCVGDGVSTNLFLSPGGGDGE